MCGIVARVDGGDVSPALALLAERGPHGAAMWRNGSLVLGLARLAIVAPASAARVHADDNFAAVMNGELYEHRAWRTALGIDDVESDQAVVLALFARGGVDAIVHARGPVTCAVADARAGTITLVRDRFGKRPLFVDADERGLVGAAASEMKALLAMRGTSRALRFSSHAVTRFLSRGIVEDDAPIVDGIASVSPGTSTVVGAEQGEARRPAPLRSELKPGSLAEALRAACARRIDGLEVPAAVLLSGGLDSSVIAALVRHRVGVAYTMRIRSSDTSDESDKARAMANALGLELRVVDVAPPTLNDLASNAWRLEAPDAFVGFGVAHAYATLARRLRDDGIRVVLTGEGADELFLGYAWQRAQAAAQNGWPFSHGASGDRAIVNARAWAAASMASTRNTRALEVFLRARFGDPLGGRDPLSFIDASALALPTATGRTSQRTSIGAERRREDSLLVDLPMWPLRIADRMLMGHGIEPRAPFLDEDVVDAALALPARDHESPHVDKPLLRALAHDVLPANVEIAPKQGFGAWSWPGAETTRAWAARLADEGTLLARADTLHGLSQEQTDRSALLAWRLVVLEVTARQLDAARSGTAWRP